MATASNPIVSEQTPKTSSPGPVAFDFSQPPIIEGFSPQPRIKDETFKEKFLRKTKENPFVPIGCLGTAGALMYGLRAFHQGKTRQSQLLMRGRIFAQGFTVVAIIVGVFATAVKPKQWAAPSMHPNLPTLPKHIHLAMLKILLNRVRPHLFISIWNIIFGGYPTSAFHFKRHCQRPKKRPILSRYFTDCWSRLLYVYIHTTISKLNSKKCLSCIFKTVFLLNTSINSTVIHGVFWHISIWTSMKLVCWIAPHRLRLNKS